MHKLYNTYIGKEREKANCEERNDRTATATALLEIGKNERMKRILIDPREGVKNSDS